MVGVLGFLAVLAAAVQEFTAGALVRTAGDGPPALPLYQQGFTAFRFGAASVYATLMLAVLVVLGVGAGLLIVLSGLRMEVDDRPDRSDRGIAPRTVWPVVAAALLLGVLAVVWCANKDRLGGSTNTTAPGRSTGEVLVYTRLPPFVSALLGVVVAALAAFGISGLRPFGRYSELLLLPFAPFLFVGSARWPSPDTTSCAGTVRWAPSGVRCRRSSAPSSYSRWRSSCVDRRRAGSACGRRVGRCPGPARCFRRCRWPESRLW